MKRTILFLSVLALALLVVSGVALAKPDYQGAFTAKYAADKGSKLDSCNLCHKSDMSLNKYGTDFAAAGHDFAAIEAKDSDGDGASNIAEINAKTLPGDASSKPAGTGNTGSGGGSTPSTPPAPPKPPVDKSVKFWDLDGNWAEGVARQSATLGIFKGRPDNSFGPNDNVSRAELSAIILRTFNLPEGGTATFKDVSANDWFASSVTGAAQYVPGYADGTFKPNAAADRQTTVVAILRATGLEGNALAMDPAEVASILADFSDAKSVAVDKTSYFAYAIRSGIMTGNSNKTVTPNGSLSRGQLAQIFLNLYTSKISLTTLANNFVGSETCKTCHSQKYTDWKTTAHSKMIQDVKAPGAIVGDFSTNTKFTVDKVAMVVAGQMTTQRYLEKRGDEYWYLPAAWNIESKTWSNLTPSKWSGACTGCHVVGYSAKTKTWFENGVTCEACHGPGAEHVALRDKNAIKYSVGDDMCSRCHSGQVTALEKTGHATFFKTMVEGTAYYGDSCIKCHSATVIVAKYNGETAPKLADFKTGALKNDRTGITCVVCHDPHKRSNEAQLRNSVETTCTVCHTSDKGGATYPAGSAVHHPTKEMFDGVGAIDVPTMPAPKVIACADCHMAGGSHAFVPGTPTVTVATKHGPVEENPCAECHTGMTKEKVEEFQKDIEAQMAEVKGLLDQAKTKLDAAKTAGTTIASSVELLYKQAYTNYSFLEADKSKGIHNPPYYREILKVSKAKLEDFLSKVK
ncbi:MAG: ammonia-forming cytochrome c nitrite reductase subunit c552 [Bacillota bacterium]